MKLNSLYALCFVLALVSCSKDDETPTFKQEDLIGSWSRTSTTIEDDGMGCEGEELAFTSTTITQTTICDGTSSGSVDYDYTYANNTASTEFLGISMDLVVTSLNATTLKINWKMEGQSYGTSTYEKQ